MSTPAPDAHLDLPAPAGSLELYTLLNAEECARFRQHCNQRFADAIYRHLHPMTDHRATPEQWDDCEQWAKEGGSSHACLLDLRARVEALEANSKPASNPSLIRSSPDHFGQVNKMVAGSLVERVADAIGAADDEGLTNMTWSYHARAAIREVAAWMTSNPETLFPPSLVFALEQEAAQPTSQED